MFVSFAFAFEIFLKYFIFFFRNMIKQANKYINTNHLMTMEFMIYYNLFFVGCFNKRDILIFNTIYNYFLYLLSHFRVISILFLT